MLRFTVEMSGLEEIDWEAAVGFAKRFGGIVLAVLFALAARRKKKAASEDEPEEEQPAEETAVEIPAIEPGDDAARLASQYSRGDSS